jgi:Tol biopolymer transport system component
MTWY